MKVAAAYIRVSSERQDEYSPDSQIKLIRDYAKKNDIEVPDDLVFFDDGISAKTATKRTQFNNMIALAKEKEPPFDTILVWKFSRFARNQEESIVYKNILRKKGISVVSISEPIIDSPFGDLIERIIEWMDEYYLINLSTEVKRGMTEKLTRGEALCPPAFGYSIVDGKYIPNPDEAPHVVEIFKDFVGGMAIRQISTKCAALGLRTHRGNPIEDRGIRYMLYNPVYVGKIRWSTDGRASSKRDFQNPNTVIVDGVHEPIISQELWDKAQAKLTDIQNKYSKYQRSEQVFDYMLKGLMKCECGATMTRLANNACPSMQCHRYTKANGICTTSHSLSIAKANKLVIEFLEKLVKEKKFTFVQPEEIKQTVDYDSLIKKEKARLARAKEAYLNEIDTVEEYKANKARITKAIEQLEKERDSQIEEVVDVDEFADKVKSVIKTIKNAAESESAKNAALRSVLSHITYDKTHSTLLFYFHS